MIDPEAPNEDLARAEFAFKVRSYHHNALWEEQKHFTWMISILLSAQLLVLTAAKLGRVDRAVLVLAAATVGLILALTAFRVQRREGDYFRNANVVYVELHNKVFPELQLGPPAPQANKSVSQLIRSFAVGKAGVRDYFQMLFLAFSLVFAGLGAYALALL